MEHKHYYKLRLITALIILLAAICAIIGFYPIKFFDMEFIPLLQRTLINFSIISAVLLGGLALMTILFGRFYCSTLCPLGILQELFALISRKVFKRKYNLQKNLPLKYFIAALTIGCLIGGSAIFIRYIDLYTLFGSAFSLSILGLAAIIILIPLVFFKNRFFCTNICPVGAILGYISIFSLNKIYIDKERCISCGMCEKICQSGCINSKEKSIDNETCVKCLECFNVCPKNGIKFGKNQSKEVKFSIKRRQLIICTAALALFGAAIKAGVEISKNAVKKARDLILPAGAESKERMANTCLNCNICINNCPNKILTKADDKFDAVHIDYSIGEGYCKFDCNECSKTCPSGAIKKITIAEKQRIRIAMAAIIDDKCNGCGICVHDCPTGAISKVNGYVSLNGSKCIGCGRCKKSCPSGAIEIYGINKQSII